jgi:hypothetical protein
VKSRVVRKMSAHDGQMFKSGTEKALSAMETLADVMSEAKVLHTKLTGDLPIGRPAGGFTVAEFAQSQEVDWEEGRRILRYLNRAGKFRIVRAWSPDSHGRVCVQNFYVKVGK